MTAKDLRHASIPRRVAVDDASPLLLFPQSSPNEPVVLYEGDAVLRQGVTETRGTGSATMRWFPTPGIQLDVTVVSGPLPKLGKTVGAELGNLVGDVLVSSQSFGGINPTLWPGKVAGFVSCVTDRDTGGLAWLRFQVVNSLNFLTPGLSAVPGDPTTVGIHGEQRRDAIRTTGITSCAVAMRRGPWDINLVEGPESSATYKTLNQNGGYAFTHIGEIKRIDGTVFTTQDVAPILTCLAYFLSFVRGAACSLPIRWGGDANGRIVWRHFGSPIVDQWSGPSPNWFARHQGDTLSPLFDEFCAAWADEDLGPPFRMALDWYRRCNAQSGGVRGALILGLTALELLGTLIVVDDAGKMAARKYDNLAAHKKIAELLDAINVKPDIPGRYENLAALAASNGWPDACAALTELRHGLVHPTRPKRRMVLQARDAAFEAWQVSLWLQELALLYLLAYDGNYTNRSQARTAGEVEPVPWSKNGQAAD